MAGLGKGEAAARNIRRCAGGVPHVGVGGENPASEPPDADRDRADRAARCVGGRSAHYDDRRDSFVSSDASAWSTPDIDIDKPSAARIYDALLGGGFNFAADREMVKRILEVEPDGEVIARRNRRMVIRAAQWMARQGYDQYLDVGCGLPVTGAVHEVVRQVLPGARVVYVDNEPVAVAHGGRVLRDVERVVMVGGDLRVPATYLDAPATLELLDFSRPLVVVLAAVMHFVQDDENPAGIMAELRDRLVSGSRIIFSHGSAQTEATSAAVTKLYTQSTNRWVSRNVDQLAPLFAGYQVDEGPTWVTNICPDPDEAPVSEEDARRSQMLGAILSVP